MRIRLALLAFFIIPEGFLKGAMAQQISHGPIVGTCATTGDSIYVDWQ